MPEEPIRFSPEISTETEPINTSPLGRIFKGTAALLVILFVILTCLYWYTITLNKPTENFPVNKPITIELGTEVRAITEILQRESVVQSDVLLYFILVFLNEPTDIKASTYLFDKPLSTFEVAERLTKGDFDTDLVRFTHFEGESATKLAKRAAETLPNFNAEAFITAAVPFEGRLFPDTYFIPVDYTDEELLILMLDTFNEKTATLEDKITQHSLSLDEILVLASVVEREANTLESKKIVSGILQNRLSMEMPLQADASIEYVLDKPLGELTPEDLEIDSPYNTYLNIGLPPTPIGNPGLEAIEAVLEPTESEYYYYITDNEGEFHYSKTYGEHLKNVDKYLR